MWDLTEIAKQAMEERGFLPEFPPRVISEVGRWKAAALPRSPYKDLREIPWVSIDNVTSKDLDQLTYASGNRIFVAISDVDALVSKGSEADRYALTNTTSVYTPTITFPMLPEPLSHHLTSLVEHEDRAALVTEIELDDDGKFLSWDIYYAWVKNHAKLAYPRVGEALQNGSADPQLQLQDKLAQRIEAFRLRQGALNFDTIELETEVVENQVVGIKEAAFNRAHSLIENFMIASNIATVRFLRARGLPTLRRAVREPKRWGRIVDLAKDYHFSLPDEPDAKALQTFLTERKAKDPDAFADLSLAIIKLVGRGEYIASFPGKKAPGHFDLAVLDYAHTTAPNRRYPDLVNQRLIKSTLFQTPLPYKEQELIDIAAHCSQKEDDATKVERRMLKSAAAVVLSSQIGREFPAIVTGINEHGTWVRLDTPAIEGKLVRGEPSLDVGDKIRVKLLHTDVVKGFIDFERI